MKKIDKLIKYERHKSKANKLAKEIKIIQYKDRHNPHIGIKTYKKNLQLNKNKNTKYMTISKSKSSSKKQNNIILEKLHINTNKIIQPDVLQIKDMEPIVPDVNPIVPDVNPIVPDVKPIVPVVKPIVTDVKPIVPYIKPIVPDIEPIMKKSNKMPTIKNYELDNYQLDNSNKYIIAIPSYKRSDIIQTHTLAVLNRHKIRKECISIFVANQEEHDIYKTTLPPFLYNNIVIGSLGLKNQRNFISNYYPEGQYVVEMDDDIKEIMQLVVKKKNSSKGRSRSQSRSKSRSKKIIKSVKTVKPIEDLDAFIRKAFEMCIESNIFLWGVYPLVNSHFMTYKITTDLRFIVGPMWGMINRHRQDLQLTINEKENSERTLQFWKADGAVLRFNNIGIDTKYYKNKGGMQFEGKNRKEEALKSVYYLNKMYPTLTKVSLTKKSGVPEIKMIR